MGPLKPLFWTSGDVCPGFQSQGGSLACFLACVIIRFTCGATPADCIKINLFVYCSCNVLKVCAINCLFFVFFALNRFHIE